MDKVYRQSVSRIVFRLFASSILSVLILSAFIYFYRHSLGMANPNKTTDVTWYPNQFCSNMQEGFSWFHFDENGFNNCFPPKKEKIDILLIGSSQLEAIQIKPNENIGFLLNVLIPDYYSYNIGISAHFLPVNVNNLLNAYNYYKPNNYIVIETGRIVLEIQEMINVLNGKLKRKIPIDKGINYYIKFYAPPIKSLLKKVNEQISLWKNNSTIILKKNNKDQDNNFINKEEYKETLNKFLSFARKSVPETIPIMVFYHPTYTLQTDGSIKNDTDKWYFDTFEEACKNNNIIFIDTDNDLQELYKTRHILPYGFINTAVGTGHLNKYGHEVIAKCLAKEILKLEGKNHGTK